MTNAQMNRKAGRVYVPQVLDYENALKGIGMTVSNERQAFGSLEIRIAEFETTSGKISIMFGDNGTARIDKPNGSYKWYYEKTPAQLSRAVAQVIEFWNR